MKKLLRNWDALLVLVMISLSSLLLGYYVDKSSRLERQLVIERGIYATGPCGNQTTLISNDGKMAFIGGKFVGEAADLADYYIKETPTGSEVWKTGRSPKADELVLPAHKRCE